MHAHPAPRVLWPVVVFVVATCAITLALLALQPLAADAFDPRLLLFTMFGPTLGALVTFACFPRFAREAAPDRIPARAFAARIGVALGVMAAYLALMFAVTRAFGIAGDGGPFAGGMFALYLALQLLGAFGEEYGWRGTLQPALETRMGPLAATTVTSLIWSLWHVQYLASPLFFTGFALSGLAISLAMRYLARGSRLQRAVIAAIVHWGVNVSLVVCAQWSMSLADLPTLLPALALAAGVAAAAWVMRRRRDRSPAGTRARPARAATTPRRAAGRVS